MRRLTSDELAQLHPLTLGIYEVVLEVLDGSCAGLCVDETSSLTVLFDDVVDDSNQEPEPRGWHYVLGKLYFRSDPDNGIAFTFGNEPKIFILCLLEGKVIGDVIKRIMRIHHESDQAFLQDIRAELERCMLK